MRVTKAKEEKALRIALSRLIAKAKREARIQSQG